MLTEWSGNVARFGEIPKWAWNSVRKTGTEEPDRKARVCGSSDDGVRTSGYMASSCTWSAKKNWAEYGRTGRSVIRSSMPASAWRDWRNPRRTYYNFWGPGQGTTYTPPEHKPQVLQFQLLNIVVYGRIVLWHIDPLLGNGRGLLGYSRDELLLLEAGSWGTGIVRKPKGSGMSAVGSRYQATGSEDCNKLRRLTASYSNLWSV
jgi:hypothetical protein